MKRYTKRLDDGKAIMDCKNCQASWTKKTKLYCTALYCRNRMKDYIAEIEDILGDDYELERLRELVNADREGRLHIYPDPKYPAMHCDPVGPEGTPGVLDKDVMLIVHGKWYNDQCGGIECSICNKRPSLLVKTNY